MLVHYEDNAKGPRLVLTSQHGNAVAEAADEVGPNLRFLAQRGKFKSQYDLARAFRQIPLLDPNLLLLL